MSHKLITYRCFKNFNDYSFVNDLSNSNIFLSVEYFCLNQVLNQNAPLKNKRIKRLQQPDWYYEDIKQARLLRDRYKRDKNWKQYGIC